MGDTTQLITVTAAIATAIGGVAGGLATAWVMVKRANSETTLADKKQTREVQAQVIDQLTSRVEALESKLDKKEDDHRECERKLGVLEGRVEQLSKEMGNALQRHDTKTLEQAIAMKDETIKLLEKKIADVEAKLPTA